MRNDLLRQYIHLTEFLGRALGPDYEIALHDLSGQDQSIVAIANSHVSGRKVGAPLTNVALQIIADKSYQSSSYRLNYRGLSSGKKMLRSSTLFIKDEHDRLIGLLCINFDDSRYQELSERVLRLCHPDSFVETNFQYDEQVSRRRETEHASPERFHNTIDAVAADAVSAVLRESGLAPDRMTQEEKLMAVTQLDKRGVFLLKGAVKDVARALHCSQASVYRYLSKSRGRGT